MDKSILFSSSTELSDEIAGVRHAKNEVIHFSNFMENPGFDFQPPQIFI